MEYPTALKYTPDHEWLHPVGHKTTAGMTAFAVDLQAFYAYLTITGHD
jgi:glycine cleavage system H lipoate-binding protein